MISALKNIALGSRRAPILLGLAIFLQATGVVSVLVENVMAQNKNGKRAVFSHAAKKHSALACSSCHKFPSPNWKTVRPKDEAFPDVTDYPRHESCLSCHRKEFFGSPNPSICTVCHVNPSPRDSRRFPFANPREIFDRSEKGRSAISDFQIFFPHEQHIEIVAQIRPARHVFLNASLTQTNKRSGEESCAVCHQIYQPQGDSDDEFVSKPPSKLGDSFWLKKGTFMSAPTGHTGCFTCHSVDTGITPAPNDCAVCHRIDPAKDFGDFDPQLAGSIADLDRVMLTSWRKRYSAGTFRHELSSHAEMECANCHNASALNTLDPKSSKVAITSCNFCHITETADDGGILNYEVEERKKNAGFQCVKCHLAFGSRPIPKSHLEAIGGK